MYYWSTLWECIEECDEVDAAEAAFNAWVEEVDEATGFGWPDEDPMALLPPLPALDGEASR